MDNHLLRRMGRHIFPIIARLAVGLAVGGAVSTSAVAVDWTAGEIVSALEHAKRHGQPFDRLLAEKVQEELAKANLKIIDESLVYEATSDGTYQKLDVNPPIVFPGDTPDFQGQLRRIFKSIDAAKPRLGSCDLDIPAGALRAARTKPVTLTAEFSNSGTYIGFDTTPSTVVLTLGVKAEVLATTTMGLEWCGRVIWPVSCQKWGKNPACPPCPSKGPCLPCPLDDICLVPGVPKVESEPWTDWASTRLSGPLKGEVKLTLGHSFSNNTITVGTAPTLSGSAEFTPRLFATPAIPNTRLIKIPGASIPHVDTSPVLSGVLIQTESLLVWFRTDPLVNAVWDSQFQEDVIDKMLKKQQKRLAKEITPVQLTLPTVSDFDNLDPTSEALVAWVLDYLRDNAGIVGEFVFDVVKNNWTEVLYYALTDNRAALTQLFAYQAVCPGLEKLTNTMAVAPLYSRSTGVCAAIDPYAPGAAPHYSDARCKEEVAFQPPDFRRFCRDTMTPGPNPIMGNAAAWPSLGLEVDPFSALPSTKWSLSSAARLAVGVEPIAHNHVPYVKRVNYRTVRSCELEMRIYKKALDATNLTPLLWIHGGAWKYRGAGYVGLESLLSSYTEENFIVFTPFYRLSGNADGNKECRKASLSDMTADVEAALDWVQANGAQFGASATAKIAVTGQSAGAHLAGWLMTHRPKNISRGMLVYPPTDFHDFVSRLQGYETFPALSDDANSAYNSAEAQALLEGLLQIPPGDAKLINLNAPPPDISENAFATMVRANPDAYPPAFIIHGTRDALLTHSQSEILCEAYSGSPVKVNWTTTPDLRKVFSCGNGEAHFLREADHAFEICLTPSIPSLCRAGSAASVELVADSLSRGRLWLADRQVAPLAIHSVTASAAVDATPVVDNKLETHLALAASGDWIQLDLGKAQTVNALAMAWVEDQTRFEILSSSDAAKWTLIHAGQSHGSGLELETFELKRHTARYIRIVGYGAPATPVSGLAEVKIYPANPVRALHPVSIGASQYADYPPESAADHDLSTHWLAVGENNWLKLDLGTPKYLSSVGIAWYRGHMRATRFEIETSMDGNTWMPLSGPRLSSGTTSGEELYDIPPVVARHVRIVGHGTDLDAHTSISEVHVYGTD